jgi:hypothetical protein
LLGALNTLKTPTPPTLKRYGLDLEDWQALALKQNSLCAVCNQLPTSGRLHIDHFHKPGFKKLPPVERKRCVRGLCCYSCNRFRISKNTINTALAVAAYLLAFEVKSQ